MPRLAICSRPGDASASNLSSTGNSVSTTVRRSAPRDHLRQAVIVLRAHHQIDRARAAQDLLALGLRDAAGDRDHHVAALGGGFFLHHPQAAELG